MRLPVALRPTTRKTRESGWRYRRLRGQVVGAAGIGGAFDDELHTDAFVWEDGVMAELPSRDDESYWASGINESGQIVGGSPADVRAVIWVPHS